MTLDNGDRDLVLIALRRFRQECGSQMSGDGNYRQVWAAAWHCTELCARKIDDLIVRVEDSAP